MTTYDINHTSKHDFINLELLSRFHNHILIVMIYSAFPPFDVDFDTILKLMPYKLYVKCGISPLMC